MITHVVAVLILFFRKDPFFFIVFYLVLKCYIFLLFLEIEILIYDYNYDPKSKTLIFKPSG